jgi:hypothetical protein
MVKDTVSIIIRYHKQGSFELLKDALFSVSLQSVNTEIVLMLHNCDKSTQQEIECFTDKLKLFSTTIKNVIMKNHNSKEDIRSKLLNDGIKVSNGEFVCFLDYDDIIYSNSFSDLKKGLEESGAALSVGGCRTAFLEKHEDFFYTKSKKPHSKEKFSFFDMLSTNYMPIHSFMISLKKVDKKDIFFNEKIKALEDYDLLLRLISKYEFYFKTQDTPTCEYRIRNEPTHTTPFHDLENMHNYPIWIEGRKHIDSIKKELTIEHNIDTINKMQII